MKLIIESNPGSAEQLALEASRVADLLDEGFTSGQVLGEDGSGWWELEDSPPATES